jgi:uncharacterized membrane protein
MNNDTMSIRGAVARVLSALLLVLLTVNPSGHSYVHWIAGNLPHLSALQVVSGLLLLIGWVVYVTATLRSLGLLGVGLLVALFSALIWLAVSRGWLQPSSGSAWLWMANLMLGLVLGIGMCWSFMRRRLSGQADVDEVHGP